MSSSDRTERRRLLRPPPAARSEAFTADTADIAYRFGFVLSTALGNSTRYQILRKFAELDPQVECTWAPVKHFIAPGEPDPFRRLPTALRTRAVVMQQSMPVLRRLGALDAVMIHLYEADIVTALRGYFRSRPLRVVSSDGAPAMDPETYPFHPHDAAKAHWRRALRLRIDLWRARRADLLIPFSAWAGDILVRRAGIPPERVVPVHVGLDLDHWRYTPKLTTRDHRVKLLFVGGEFVRKGGPTLLEAFGRHLSANAELHLVSKSAPANLPPNVFVHDDLRADDARLMRLYQEADIFVLPTTSDLSSWATLEAMASGCPVVVTSVGGIVDIVTEGETGFIVAVGDVDRLGHTIKLLIDRPELRRRMGAAGRNTVERRFNAAINVPQILSTMKDAVDRRRLAPHLARQ